MKPIVPERERSCWQASDIDEARTMSFREKANQSKPRLTYVPKCLRVVKCINRSRRESNPHLRFRKPLFYPLNYGNNDLKRINGSNQDGQDTLAERGDFSRASFALDSRQLLESIMARGISM